MKKYKFQKTLLALSIAAILAGCDSGSSSDDDDSVSIDASLQGTAAKGIIINGVVTADELNTDGSVSNANVGSATTGGDGSYSMDLNDDYEGGPIRITVTKNDDTTTVCDAISGCGPATDATLDENSNNEVDFGEQYKPSNLSMMALLPDAEDGETIDVQVTPFTNMAAEKALDGSLSDTTITAANSEVSALLGGLDILRTEPVDITDLDGDEDANAVAYAALTAAIAEGAADGTNEPDLGQALSDLATQFAAGTFAANDMQDILDDAAAAFVASGALDTSGLLDVIQNDVDDAIANSGGIIDPEPNPNAGDTDVELAKDFISDLRTWGTVIQAETEAPSLAFETQLDMVDAVYDTMDGGLDKAIETGVDAIVDFSRGDWIETDLTGYVAHDGLEPEGTFTAGTISSTSTADGVEYAISGATVNTSAGLVSLDMVIIAPEDQTPVSTVVLGIQSISADDGLATITVNSGTVTLNLGEEYTVDYDAIDPPMPDVDSMVFDMDVSLTENKTVENNIVVDATDPVTFTGDLSFTVYPLADGNGQIINAVPGSLEMDGSVSNTTGDSFDMNFSVSIPDAASITPLGTVYDLDSTYAENNGGDYLISWTNDDTDFSYSHFTGNFLNATFDPNDLEVSYSYDNFGDVGGGVIPAASLDVFVDSISYLFDEFSNKIWIDGQGEYYRDFSTIPDYSVDGHVAFTLDEVDVEFFDQTQPLIGTAGLQFTAQLDGLPEADISITGSTTAFEAGNADMTVSYGTRSITFEVSNDTADGEVGEVTISNQDGVELILNFDNLEDLDETNDVRSVTINDKEIAIFEELDNGLTKVSYIDGTFETF